MKSAAAKQKRTLADALDPGIRRAVMVLRVLRCEAVGPAAQETRRWQEELRADLGLLRETRSRFTPPVSVLGALLSSFIGKKHRTPEGVDAIRRSRTVHGFYSRSAIEQRRQARTTRRLLAQMGGSKRRRLAFLPGSPAARLGCVPAANRAGRTDGRTRAGGWGGQPTGQRLTGT